MTYTQIMAVPITPQSLIAAIALATLAHFGNATTVYRTVDADGAVTFSDTPPGDGSTAETLEIATPEVIPDSTAKQRLEDMRETTDRMVADRMKREKHRAELRRLKAEEELYYEPFPAAEHSEPVYIFPQTNRRALWNHRRWHHGKPVRPPEKPGHRPGRPVHLPSYATPGYHDYPASLIRRSYNPRVRAAVTGSLR